MQTRFISSIQKTLIGILLPALLVPTTLTTAPARAGGNFTSAGTCSSGCNNIAKFNPDFNSLLWNTFLGSGNVFGEDIAVDRNGNIYVAGHSDTPWGTPVVAYAGGRDGFVAKLNSSGVLQWNTFLGSSSDDGAFGIALDESGNVYVTGYSDNNWGTPVNAFAGQTDAFVAKLDSNGVLQWNTFMGSASFDSASGITVDESGNTYVTGDSSYTWGKPVNAHAGGGDVFATKLDSNGVLQWNTFMGSPGDDFASGIAVDRSGNIYVTGTSVSTWGTPANTFAGGYETFAAALEDNGVLQWNTFMGSAGNDYANGMGVDGNGNIYITGQSDSNWGTPINSHGTGSEDGFVARLDSHGILQWNTFLGAGYFGIAHGVVVDGNENVFVVGYGTGSWGTPENAYSGGSDAFIERLDSSGELQWSTFLGSTSNDKGYRIATNGNGYIYATGFSEATWGTPVNAFSGTVDALVVKLDSGTHRLYLPLVIR